MDKLAGIISTAFQTMGIFSILQLHPNTPSDCVASIIVEHTLRPDGALHLDYTLTGNPAALRIPPTTPPVRADELWRHTCFEAFIRAADEPTYREFNFSPSGCWQAYAFTGYRQGRWLQPASAPQIVCQREPASFRLQSVISPDGLPPGRRLLVGLNAVIESNDGKISYWALQHPPGKPDFHHLDTFALELNLPCPHP